MAEIQKRAAAAALLLLLAVLAVRDVVLLARFAGESAFGKYLSLADRVVAGNLPAERMNDVSPLYLWCVSAGRAIHLNDQALSWLQIAATLLVAALAALTARALAGDLAAFVAAAAILASRTVVINASELEPEALILLLNTIAIWLLLRRPLTAGSAFAGGCAAAASMMTRPTAVLPLVVLGFLCARDRWKSFIAGVVLGINVAVTGHASIMNAGTVFYEGLNPHASGYSGVRPGVVEDLRVMDPAIAREPDPLHIAFRIIVSRLHHDAATPEETNRYWTSKALAFVREFPMLAARLTARKFFLALHSYEAWDVTRSFTRSATLPPFWIPFGLLFALAAAAFVRRLRDRRIVALALIVASYTGAMVLFHVTSRQRNALMPAVAVLAGVAIVEIVSVMRARETKYSSPEESVRRLRAPTRQMRGAATRRCWDIVEERQRRRWRVAAARFGHFLPGSCTKNALAIVLSVAFLTIVLTREYAAQREDRYFTLERVRVGALAAQAARANDGGDSATALRLTALQATYPAGVDRDVPIAPPAMISDAAYHELARAGSDARRFDIALALQIAGQWRLADQILESLEQVDYRPWRGLTAVPSVAFYRSIGLLHLQHPEEAKRELLRAQREAPADDGVLALTAVALGDPESRRRLFSVYDPFAARLALVRAHIILRQLPEALTAAGELSHDLPEWQRAALIEAALHATHSQT
jgi:uncharacterized membrane protein YhaH (DUF805 family)